MHYVLFLDLKQFFPAIKRRRGCGGVLVGLPDEVIRLAKAVFLNMRAKFDTAHGLSDEFDILGGDLMGCVLSPSHARCLLRPSQSRLPPFEWSARLGLRQESTARGSNHDAQVDRAALKRKADRVEARLQRS